MSLFSLSRSASRRVSKVLVWLSNREATKGMCVRACVGACVRACVFAVLCYTVPQGGRSFLPVSKGIEEWICSIWRVLFASKGSEPPETWVEERLKFV